MYSCRWRYLFLALAVLLSGWVYSGNMGCGAASTPTTGGGNSPVPIELPSATNTTNTYDTTTFDSATFE